MKTILFQGDSVTDTCRSREDDNVRGSGYPVFVDGELGYSMPQQFRVSNRGIGGNRSLDLLQRWNQDCIALKPDYLSIMIGVNDVWHEIDYQNGAPIDRYREFLRMMIEDVQNRLPATKLILMTPFITHGTATDRNWDYFRSEVDLRIAAVEDLAKKYNLPCVHTQKAFDQALEIAPANNWTYEGVHPTSAGHLLIANAWLKVFQNGNF